MLGLHIYPDPAVSPLVNLRFALLRISADTRLVDSAFLGWRLACVGRQLCEELPGTSQTPTDILIVRFITSHGPSKWETHTD